MVDCDLSMTTYSVCNGFAFGQPFNGSFKVTRMGFWSKMKKLMISLLSSDAYRCK
jgi:hypothetical protein